MVRHGTHNRDKQQIYHNLWRKYEWFTKICTRDFARNRENDSDSPKFSPISSKSNSVSYMITSRWYQDVSRPAALQRKPPPCHLLAKAPHYPGQPPEIFEMFCTHPLLSSRNTFSIFTPLKVVFLGGMKVQNIPNMASVPKAHIMHFGHVPSSASWEGSSRKSQSQYHQL